MKRFFLAGLFFIMIVSLASAADTSQKIYPVDCIEFDAISQLYNIQGYSLPSATGPWSGAELRRMLNKIRVENLSPVYEKLYDSVHDSLYGAPEYEPDPDFGFTIDTSITTEFFAHTNPSYFNGLGKFQVENEFDNGYSFLTGDTPDSFFSISSEMFRGDLFYTFLDIPIRNTPHSENLTGATAVATNITAFQNLKLSLTSLDLSFPDRAFISAGGNNWTFQLGRDRLSWGNGESGNMLISDNLPYHNFARITTFFDHAKYTYLLDFFPHPANYDNSGQWDINHGLRFYQAHRWEGRFFNDRLSFMFTEGLMYQSLDNTVDLSIINPMFIYHNSYIRTMGNSIMSIEADYSVHPGINVYGQLTIDEFAAPGEPTPKNDVWAHPNAHGVIGGIKGTAAINDGIWHGSIEGAYTDPFLYLRGDGEPKNTESAIYGKKYDINYVVAIRRFTNYTGGNRTLYFDKYFLGYPYGGDSIVCNLNSGWDTAQWGTGSYGFAANLFYMMHGTFDWNTTWHTIGKTNWQDYVTPTRKQSEEDGPTKDRTGIQKTLDIGLSAYWYPVDTIRLFTQLDAINIWNADYTGYDAFDLQLVLGAKFSF